jgi:alkylated DNA repair dioxygenase AlkB
MPATLFEAELPTGFQYRGDFISPEEEEMLAEEIGRLAFSTFEMRGVVARRRVAFFGRTYDAGGASTSPMPAFLMPLRARAAAWAGVDAEALAMALVNEYRPGAPIGWHRDAPQYESVAGISLLSACRMKFRPYASPSALASSGKRRRIATHEITLERRSGYLMTGESRNAFEHHIPAVATLRYSITFRTLRS